MCLFYTYRKPRVHKVQGTTWFTHPPIDLHHTSLTSSEQLKDFMSEILYDILYINMYIYTYMHMYIFFLSINATAPSGPWFLTV